MPYTPEEITESTARYAGHLNWINRENIEGYKVFIGFNQYELVKPIHRLYHRPGVVVYSTKVFTAVDFGTNYRKLYWTSTRLLEAVELNTPDVNYSYVQMILGKTFTEQELLDIRENSRTAVNNGNNAEHLGDQVTDSKGLPDAPEPEEVTVACQVQGCDNTMPEGDTYTVYAGYRGNTLTVCEDCYNDSWECPRCMEQFVESYFSNASYVQTADEYWCTSCITDGAHYCDSCDNYVEDYSDCHEVEESIIHGYDFKPYPQFKWSRAENLAGAQIPRTPFYGIELETEHERSPEMIGDNFIAQFDPNEQNIYLKHDGSLSDGFEIVSHPRTLESWHEWTQFEQMCKWLIEQGAKAWDKRSCGLHVHVSRDAFKSDTHIMRFAMFFNRNQEEAVKFANRRSSYANFYDATDPNTARAKTKVTTGRGVSHFDAVNLGYPTSPTIEVRIFRPSLKIQRVLGSIELVDAIRVFTETASSTDILQGKFTWEKLIEFMESNTAKYKNALLVNKGNRF